MSGAHPTVPRIRGSRAQDGHMPLSFPFRVTHGGTCATVTESSDQHISESIAVHVLTHPGERHLNPNFGTPQLPFGYPLEEGPLQLNLNDNGWEQVRITGIDTAATSDTAAVSEITWEVN